MKSSAARLAGLWDSFWFRPGSALNLAAARVVFAAHALWVLFSRDLPALSDLPPEFWMDVPASWRWRYLIEPGRGALEYVLQMVTVVALSSALFGLLPRLACFVSGVLLYHLAPLETLFWTPNPYERGFTITVLALLTLSCSRCGDRLSPFQRGGASPGSSDHGWPLRLIQLFLCQVYLFAGYSKLFRVGFGWISAENLRAWLLVFSQQDQVAVFTRLGPWIAERPGLLFTIALGSMVFDLAFIAVLFSRRWRLVLVPLAVAFHAGILFAMNIAFLNVPQLLIFVDWERLGRRRGQPGGGEVP